jgi:hypothetical protein
MTRAVRIRFIFGMTVAGLTGALISTIAIAQTVFQQRPLTDFLKEHNWVPLPIPDNKVRPGSVIKVTKTEKSADVQWLGDFRNCGITDQELGLTRGKYPALGVGQNFAVNASLGASLLSRFGARVEAEKVNGAVLKIDESGGDAIDLLALSIWLTTPGNIQKMPAACNEFLARENVYLVSEAFRVSRGSYDLVDKNGAKVAISAAPMPGASVDAKGGISVGSTGSLIVTEDFYFGVRRVKQLAPGNFATLGSRPQAVPEADDLLRTIAQ